MIFKWTALQRPTDREQWHKAAGHLSRCEHCRMHVPAACLHKHVRIGYAERSDHDRDTSRKSFGPFTSELIEKDNNNSTDPKQQTTHLRRRHAFVRQIIMRDHKPDHGHDRLQDRCESRSRTPLAPKEKSIVESKRK